MTKPYTGFVITSDGDIMIQVADRCGFTLYSRDGDQAWPNANGLPNMSWEILPKNDRRITRTDRATLRWIVEETLTIHQLR